MSAIIYTKDIGEDIKFWTSMDKSGAKIIGCSPEEVEGGRRINGTAMAPENPIWWDRVMKASGIKACGMAKELSGFGVEMAEVSGSEYYGVEGSDWEWILRYRESWLLAMHMIPFDFYFSNRFYAGSWVNDRREGYGTGCYEDGSFYHGNWVNDEREGEGLMFFANGDTYRGQWRQGKRSGLGILVVGETGDLYEGQWLNDKKEGSGRYYYRSRRKVMVGEWAEDMCRTGSVSAYEDPIGCELSLGRFQRPQYLPLKKLISLLVDIPTLRLKDIDGLLRSKMEEIRSERFLFRVLNTPLPDLFDSDDLTHIRDVHAAAVSNSQDGILSLVSLKALVLSLFGVQFSPEDLWELCVTVGVITEEEAQRAVVLTETELKAPPESSLPNDNREVIEHVIDSLTDDEDDEEEDEDATTELREQIAYRHFIIPSSAFTLDRFARIVTLILAKLNH
ncbi:morn protein, putative [Perkinsus marinus ATCC 50983]|uniref:MORN repeat-containing protein 3 n=1 Tax=Perkinsus marinus (strain ATCC 50983 / TXsc) TaxID=423536 RepID=C5LIF2_PERM5|nr:morn protein, putative [Perkinsus marinus ATCC 50983]EER03355.1 morn protein, putative [Perkinsus marinus ATCC 50983]|eukprot:XP_002771539.1 morn protein, putative [Perkinsus marinus ATCC 50983]